MNGLKYVRIRCNLSVNELANDLGVSRQALYAWESGKKEIPEARKKQLADYFGVDIQYLGDITEEEKNDLVKKAMFSYLRNGKERYRYKPQEGQQNLKDVPIYFFEDHDMRRDDELELTQKKRRTTLQRIDAIMESPYESIESKLLSIERGCHIYDMISDFMEYCMQMKCFLKIPFYFELTNIFSAMCLAYGLKDEKDLPCDDSVEPHWGKDQAWILELSKQFKKHWEEERDYQETYHEYINKKIRDQNATKSQEKVCIEKQIADAEACYQKHLEKGEKVGMAIIDEN